MADRLRVGLVGCGAISDTYLQNAPAFSSFDVVACADLDEAAASATAAEHGLEVLSAEELIARPDIDAVLNLTIPAAHTAVNLAALGAGKHAYCEKPLAVSVADGAAVVAAAGAAGRLAGAAPDTFLGGGHQACRRLVDQGAIGEPLAATAILMHRGHEHWHPNPAFLYKPGGGPMFDMGPYFLTALVNLLGPVAEVTAMAGRGFDQRQVLSEPRHGQLIDVEVDTHVAGTMRFHSGAIATVVMSFDVSHHDLPRLQLHGTEASLAIPDPNAFSGPVQLAAGRTQRWRDQPVDAPYTENARGLGFADLCRAALVGRRPRCDASLAFHVLEAMAAFETSARERVHVAVETTVERPEPLLARLSGDGLD